MVTDFGLAKLAEALRAHTKEPPPAPRSLVPDLPTRLEEIILQALAKEPAARLPPAQPPCILALMQYLYRNLELPLGDDTPLEVALADALGLADLGAVVVVRESLDARRKGNIRRIYHLRFAVEEPTPRLEALLRRGVVAPWEPPQPPPTERRIVLPERPIIVGAGPAGLFCALHLARLGYRPILLERGQPVAQRRADVERLWREGVLDPESNMQFGEGGAGTFSDGKLTTGKRDPLHDQILGELVAAGAPPEIAYQAKPHIGTDRLRTVVTRLRAEIVALGGEVRFGARTDELLLRGNQVGGVRVGRESLRSSGVVLAIGHSARDSYVMLQQAGVAMEPKPVAVGLRIEHPRAFIDAAQYGDQAALLPAADYSLTHRQGDLAVYSFCMCPGGHVVCCASEPEQLVTNGMSYHARDAAHSNSALVVAVHPARLGWRDPLDGITFQREIEARAYRAGGGGYRAPAQRAADFVDGRASDALPASSYRPGIRPAPMDDVLPPSVCEALRGGLRQFDRRIRGFIDEGLLLAPETRTSSPVRLLRDDNWESPSTRGLYLLGEGAGYAGGIMTCALDAVRYARAVVPCEATP